MIKRVIVDGSEAMECCKCFKMAGTLAPGRQQVIAFLKRTFLIMESPIKYVVGVEERSEGMEGGAELTEDEDGVPGLLLGGRGAVEGTSI